MSLSTRSIHSSYITLFFAILMMHSNASGALLPGDGTFNLPVSGSASLPCGSALTIYDDGGPLGAYSIDPSGWLTLENSGASIIHLEGTFSFECGYDNVAIWDGATPGITPAIVAYTCGGSMVFESLPGQTLSISVHGDGSLSWAGFEWTLYYIGECGVANFPLNSGYELECGNNFNLYDDGGSEGFYVPNNISYVSLDNNGSGVISISGTCDLGEGDSLVIYHGNTQAKEWISTFTGINEILFTSEQGMDVILYFYSDENVESTGVDLQVSYSGSCECTVEDLVQPYVLEVPTTIYLDEDGYCGATATWVEPFFYDNCSALTITSSHYPGAYISVPGTTVTYTVSDQTGNSTSVSFDIVVEDITPPQIWFDVNTINMGNDAGQCGAIVTWNEPWVSDYCSEIDEVWSTHQSGDFFSVGTDTVTYYVMDMAGLVSSTDLYITIVDLETPMITCPSNIITCEGNTVNFDLPLVEDNCVVTPVQTSGMPSGSVFGVGTTTNSFSATDSYGNFAQCFFNVLVNPLPEVTLAAPNDTLCIADNTMTLNGQPEGGNYSGQGLTDATINAAEAGAGNWLYEYAYTDENGCTDMAEIEILIDACIGISDIQPQLIEVYPNPAQEILFVQIPETSQLTVYDISGKLVKNLSLQKGTHQINVADLPRAAYALQIITTHGKVSDQRILILN